MGREPVTYDYPSLEPVLRETLGVILFQEQVLQVAMALPGCSAGQAESLRRAMSRKRSREAIAKLKQQFIEGCLGNGVSKQVAEAVFQKIAGFAEFGFPKAHAAAFGLLAYQTAWLRTYYPTEFLCALFNAQPMGFYGPHMLVNDGKRHGVEVLSPDVNRSEANCTVEGDAVRIGLLYRSDGRNGHERQLALPLPTEQDMVSLPAMTAWDRMGADYAILGLSPNHHPMAFLRSRLHEGVVPSRMLESPPDGAPVEVAGLVVCRQRPGTAKGFVFLVLEDEFGLVNVIVKPHLYERERSLVRAETFVIVHGELQRRDGTVNVAAEGFEALRADGALAPQAHNFG